MIENTRIQVARISKEMLDRGLTDGTSGNISILDVDNQLVAVTPSGMPYHSMSEEEIPVINFSGEIVWGNHTPTSEYRMHLAALKAKPEVRAVIHTHSHFAIALACVHQTLPAVTVDMAAYCGKEAPVIPYQTPGTEKLAAAVADFVKKGYKAMLLANHGALFVSSDPNMLIEGAEALELAAMAFVRGRNVGSPQPIPDRKVDRLLEIVYGEQRTI